MAERNMKNSDSKGKHTQYSSNDDDKNAELRQEVDYQISNSKDMESKNSHTHIVSDIREETKCSDVYEELVIDYMDDGDSEGVTNDAKNSVNIGKQTEDLRQYLSLEPEKELNVGKETFDSDARSDSTSPQIELHSCKTERASRVPKKLFKKPLKEISHGSKFWNDRQGTKKLQFKSSNTSLTKHSQPSKEILEAFANDNESNTVNVLPETSSEQQSGDSSDHHIDYIKEIDSLDETSISCLSSGPDDETGIRTESIFNESKVISDKRIKEMALRIEKLEGELREVAALEIALYSVSPEHGSSSHKVHTPARRLSRLYVHACKHWGLDKRVTIARNTVSGLVLVSKSCGNDVARLTYWWSNTIVLREIISQVFRNSHNSNTIGKTIQCNGKRNEDNASSFKVKNPAGRKPTKMMGFTQVEDDWKETRTYTSALEKIESWIFSRIVESVWWQTLTPQMQSPVEISQQGGSFERLLMPNLGGAKTESFSINLWRSAFMDAYQRLCPVRAAGHHCGCLPVLASMVMEQCVARLDVAMFNAILRESDSEIPTDPVSDPIVDTSILPILPGYLSFGSGAQLKNSIGTWSRCLTDLFGMDSDNLHKDGQTGGDADERQGGNLETKTFRLLNALSDLLMLPKDMLIDRSIREEVCSTLGLHIIKRILCNFIPDEFCSDPVPGAVLELLNQENMLEKVSSDGEVIHSVPCLAPPVLYRPPDISEKVTYAGSQVHSERNTSILQRRGYTSDDELDELDSPLTSIIDKIPSLSLPNGNGKPKESSCRGEEIVRYRLLRDVWSSY